MVDMTMKFQNFKSGTLKFNPDDRKKKKKGKYSIWVVIPNQQEEKIL